MTVPAIALFAYNRPEKTREVLQALQEQGADRIYIYCDGPKNNQQDLLRVKQTREAAASFPLKNKTIITAGHNLGLANSLINGITLSLEKEERLIVLEDDCLPFPQMLQFMTENLAYWQDRRDIFSISAYHFIRVPFRPASTSDVFMANRFLPWGWATWRDRWEDVLPQLRSRKNPFGSFADVPDTAGRDLLYHAYAVENNMVDSWAIPLGLLTLHRGYRHIMPARPLVNNTGMDDSGTNTGSAHNRIIPVTQPAPYSFPLAMCPHDAHDPELERLFIDSLDVMLPPAWLKTKIDAELADRKGNQENGLVETPQGSTA
ncbi:MAG: hypothetical protein ACOYYS_11015 [Chloroflexota bacterium]